MFRNPDEEFIKRGAREVTDEDVDKVINKSQEIEDNEARAHWPDS
jgi:hypothetical protein